MAFRFSTSGQAVTVYMPADWICYEEFKKLELGVGVEGVGLDKPLQTLRML